MRLHTVAPMEVALRPGTPSTSAICPGGGSPTHTRSSSRRSCSSRRRSRVSSAVPRLARALADGRIARGGLPRGRDPRVAGLGYNRRGRIPSRGPAHRRSRLAGRSDEASRHRAVHRRGDPPFSFGEDVLPVDVNVERVHAGPDHHRRRRLPALMDLGSTVCLARIPRCGVCRSHSNAHRGIREPTRKQGPFEGSFGSDAL